MNFRHPFDSRGCLKFRLEKSVHYGCISRDTTCLRELNVIIKPNRSVLLYTKRRVLERNLCVIVSTFLIFMFAEQLIIRRCVFSAVVTHPKKQQWRTSVINR